jgi:hypothetical protein
MPLEVGSVEARLSLSIEAFERGLDAAHQKLMQTTARFGQAKPADAVVANLNKLASAITNNERRLQDLNDGLHKTKNAFEIVTESVNGGLSQALIGAARYMGELGVEMAANAIAGLVDKVVQAGAAGMEYNSTLQQTEAQLRALTGSAAGAQEVMALIKQEAEQVPSIPLQELAGAATSLQPATKMAKASLEELLDTAELLAASNPEEGIKGAAFALREAVSGDYTSLIERFNMPRTAINKLKEEGVPALEIVRRSMADLGITSDLLSEQSNTLAGRWAAFQGAMLKVAGAATKEPFEAISGALGELLAKVQENGPAIEEWAKEFGASLARVVVSGADIAEKIPWSLIGGSLSNIARGAAILSEWFETAYVAGAQLVTLSGGLLGLAKAVREGKDPIQGWEQGIVAVGTSFNLLGEEQQASTDHMRAMSNEIQKAEQRAVALGRALPKLKPDEGMNTGETRAYQLKLLEQEATARESLASKQASLNEKMAESERKYVADVTTTRAQAAKAHEEYAARVVEVDSARAQALEALEKQHQGALIAIQQERTQSEEELRQGRMEAEAEYRTAVEELERSHGEKLADLQIDLSRKLEDYDRERVQRAGDLASKLEELERGYADKVTGLARQREAIEQEAADKRLGIETKLRDKLAALDEKLSTKTLKDREAKAAIENSLSARQMELVKAGKFNLEQYLSKEDKARLAEIKARLDAEQAEHDKQRTALEAAAQAEVEEAAKLEAAKLGQIEERLAKEKEVHDRAAAEANERYNLDAENRRIAHERAVADLETRLTRENEGYGRQAEELAAKRDAELAEVQAGHEAALGKLAERFGKEQESYETNRTAIQAKHAGEVADLKASLDERLAATQAKLADMRAAHQATQQDIRQQLYDTSVAHHQRMQELAEQWNGPISQVERYKQLMAESTLGGGGVVPDALRGVLGGANKVDTARAVDGIAKRALGGPLGAGQLALVGEGGPELFMSKQAGHILDARRTQAMLAGISPSMPSPAVQGGGPITVHFDMSGMTITSQADEQRLLDGMTERLQTIFMGGSTQQEVGGTRLSYSGGRLR